MLSLFRFLSIVAVIVSIQSNSAQPKHYRSMINNLINLSIGFTKFTNESQHFANEEIPDMTPQHKEVYDFVVIGAGAAGAAVAARLSEIPQVKVLLIEAGVIENLYMDIPIFATYLQLLDSNWKYYTKPSDRYCLGMKNKQCHFPRGKIMGGSTVMNYMIATRGGAEDYDRWAEMGNEGWAYKDILKYFKKLETMDIPELRSDTTYHGTEGPVHISYPIFRTPLAEHFLRAGQELGYPFVDYNAKNIKGFSYTQSTMLNGFRVSSNRAYLHPIRDRKNLYVTHKSTVSKVLIDRRTNRAIGVKFTKADRTISVFASKEVILCAGVIGSPQLLMLSGIGPGEYLADLGINVVRDIPSVGDNLMDHVSFGGLTWKINTSISLREKDITNVFEYSHVADFFLRRSGPITNPGAIDALAFIDTKQPENRSGLPDIELIFIGNLLQSQLVIQNVTNLNSEIRRTWSKYNDYFGWSIIPILLKPKSRGRIRLLANDINVKPEIVPNYYDDPEDVKTMINGIKIAINISNTKTMRVFDPEMIRGICKQHAYESHAYWECAVRTLSLTFYHQTGTCKMGPTSDPTAVVDPKLKVIGIKGLRVVDASIMPEIISGHPTLPVYMIAEKAANMIKKEWRL